MAVIVCTFAVGELEPGVVEYRPKVADLLPEGSRWAQIQDLRADASQQAGGVAVWVDDAALTPSVIAAIAADPEIEVM